MRLLYVVSNDRVYKFNKDRLAVFVKWAKNHLREHQNQADRFSHVIPSGMSNISAQIQRDCSWVLTHLEQRNDIAFSISQCFKTMKRAATSTYEYCEEAIPDLLCDVSERVDDVMPDRQVSREDAFITRMDAQNLLLKSGVGGDIATIAHDSLQELGLYYFVIDYRLLKVIQIS